MKQQKARLFYILFFYLFSVNTLLSGKENTSSITFSGSSGSSSTEKSISFTENKGQVIDVNGNLRPDILYTGEGGGNKIYLRTTGVSYVLSNVEDVMREVDLQIKELEKQGAFNKITEKKIKNTLLEKQGLKMHRIDLDFINANADAVIETYNMLSGYNNYYYAHCPQGITHVNSYNRVIQKNIYNKIDVVYYGGNKQGLKYDIVVYPGGNPRDIQLKYSGADGVEIKNGELKIKNSIGEMTEMIPKVYQNINGKIVDIIAEYILEGTTIKFKLQSYNSQFPLVIDPWATYYGGNLMEYSTGIAADNLGNAVITGCALSASFPVSPGAFQATYGAPSDAFVVKFDNIGARQWATFYGGNDWDVSNGIATDNAGNIVIAGNTASVNFPVTAGSFQTAFTGDDAFIVKFNNAGIRQWATLYEGATTAGIAIDKITGDMYITGYTYIYSNFSVLLGYQMTNGGDYDSFVIKLNASGARIWATFYGGSLEDFGYGITTDPTGNVIITGWTGSVNFPVSAGAFQATAAGSYDVFVVEFNSTGARIWASYSGGSAADYGFGITTDMAGNVFIAGGTESANFPVLGGFQMVYGGGPSTGPLGGGDAFLVKFNSAGIQQWATFYGTIDGEWAFGVATDRNNNVYLYMEAEDLGAPNLVDPCSYQPIFNGGSNAGIPEDQIIVKFTPAGQKVCSTYVGGTGEDDCDAGGGITIYGNSIFITGWTKGGYPVTPGAFQTSYGGGVFDIFVTSLCTNICEGKVLGLDFKADTTSVCSNTSINYKSIITNACDTSDFKYQWTFPGGNPSYSSATNPRISYLTPGTYSVKLVVITPCKTDSVIKADYIIIHAPPSVTVTATDISCFGLNNGNITSALNGTGPYTHQWFPGGAISDSIGGLAVGSYSLAVTDANGCTAFAQANITEPPQITIVSNSITDVSCNGKNDGGGSISVNGGSSPYNTIWSNNQAGTSLTNVTAGTYTATVTDANGCTAQIYLMITEPAILSANVSNDISICAGQWTTITAAASGGTAPYAYSWNPGGLNGNFININPSLTSIYTLTITDNNLCTAISTISVTVNSLPVVSFTANDTAGCTPLCVNFTNSCPTGVSGTWSFGDGSSSATYNGSHCYSTPGNYSVTLIVTDANSCSNTFTKNNYIIAHPKPVAAFIANPITTTLINPTIYFTDQSIGAVQWQWSFGDAYNSSSVNQYPKFTYPDKGEYNVQLIVSNIYGCTDSTSQIIYILEDFALYIPNTFTPNGDGKNDVFIPLGIGLDKDGFEMWIFDRWGSMIYHTTDMNKPWDGRANGGKDIAQIDTYVWKVRTRSLYGEKVQFIGNVNLIK